MGNTTQNSFQSKQDSANKVWNSEDGKYIVSRLNVGRGFRIRLADGGPLPRPLRGLFTRQEGAIQAITSYQAKLSKERPDRARKQARKAEERKAPKAETKEEVAEKEAE